MKVTAEFSLPVRAEIDFDEHGGRIVKFVVDNTVDVPLEDVTVTGLDSEPYWKEQVAHLVADGDWQEPWEFSL